MFRMDLPITDCLGGFLGKTGVGMEIVPGKLLIFSTIVVFHCIWSDRFLSALTGVFLGRDLDTLVLKLIRGWLKV